MIIFVPLGKCNSFFFAEIYDIVLVLHDKAEVTAIFKIFPVYLVEANKVVYALATENIIVIFTWDTF